MSNTRGRRFAKAMVKLQDQDQESYEAISEYVSKLRREAMVNRTRARPATTRSKPALDGVEREQSGALLTFSTPEVTH